MLIKPADDKQHQKSVLQNLLNHPAADATTKKRIEQELRSIQAGIRGEGEAAYEMKVHYGDSSNWMIIHDLRIEHGGLVAQIDHLIINRCLEMWVCESKHFSEGVAVNEHGEFAAFFGGKPYGVPSPIEQNNRHILILKRLFDSGVVKLPTRLGFTIQPDLKSLVLVSRGARISRPKAKIDGIEAVIKNDQLFKTIEKSMDGASPLSLAKAVGRDTLEAIANDIAKLHKPVEFDWKAKFGLLDSTAAPAHLAVATHAPAPATIPSAKVAESADEEAKPKQRLVCHSCREPVPYNVAKFCWFNKPKFGGNIFCMDCQKKVAIT
jgi:hypothetical protein